MTCERLTLRMLVDRWRSVALADSISVTRDSTCGQRSVRVEMRAASNRLVIQFFRHSNGSWFVFPDSGSRPSFTFRD